MSWKAVLIQSYGCLVLAGMSAHAQAFSTQSIPETPDLVVQKIQITDKKECEVSDSKLDNAAAGEICLNYLLPRQPRPVFATPGAFFIGEAWGSKGHHFVYGPQIGLSSVIEFPWRRPKLDVREKIGAKGVRVFSFPKSMRFVVDVALSLSANFAAFKFPNVPAEQVPASSAQTTVNVGIYSAIELGWAWWDESGNGHKVAIALGIMPGYINTEVTGDAFVLGFQPSLIAQF